MTQMLLKDVPQFATVTGYPGMPLVEFRVEKNANQTKLAGIGGGLVVKVGNPEITVTVLKTK